MGRFRKLFVFSIMNQRYAIDLFSVEKVIPAVEIIATPDKNDVITGLINLHGRIIPVLNIRKKLNIPERDIDVDDFIVIINRPEPAAAFCADSVYGVLEISGDGMIQAGEVHPELKSMEGFIKLSGDIVFIHDLEKILSSREMSLLEEMGGTDNE